MKIRLLFTGKTKEPFIREGLKKYISLLRYYAEVSIIEIREEKGSDMQRTRKREGERILKQEGSFILLDEQGRTMTSPEFARFLDRKKPAVAFVIGGAYGVSQEVRHAASDTISLSPMTFTHEMARLVLLEQVYRAFTILGNRGYHH